MRHLGFTIDYLNYATSMVYGEIIYGIHEADGSVQIPPGAMLPRPFCYRRSFVYAAVSDISYIAESLASMLVCLLHNIDG